MKDKRIELIGKLGFILCAFLIGLALSTMKCHGQAYYYNPDPGINQRFGPPAEATVRLDTANLPKWKLDANGDTLDLWVNMVKPGEWAGVRSTLELKYEPYGYDRRNDKVVTLTHKQYQALLRRIEQLEKAAKKP